MRISRLAGALVACAVSLLLAVWPIATQSQHLGSDTPSCQLEFELCGQEFRNLNCGAPIPLRFAPYGLRPITAPFAAGASNQTVSMCRNPASSSHAEYSAGV